MNILAKGALAAAAASVAIGAMAVPTFASAQPYGGYDRPGVDDGYYYDPCRRDTTQRSTTGALTGGALGAVIGSGVASHGVRTEGAVLGGLLGAVIGGNVGRSSAACTPGQYPPPPPPPQASYGDDYDRYGSGYGGDYDYTPRPYGYDDGYQGYPASVADGPPSADNCTLAESPIYLPDGRVQKRFVRVCRDASGQYQVVD